MKDLLLQLFTILSIEGFPIVYEFNPPNSSTKSQISYYLVQRYGWCPREIEVLYDWHDGQAFPSPVKELDFFFDHALFLPFDQAKLYSEVAAANDSVYLDYFTLFTSGGGEDYLIKMRGEDRGAVFYSSPAEYLGQPVKAFDSLEKLFSSVIQCYKTGAYRIENGRFRTDIKLQMQIMSELNPGCTRWIFWHG
jgi:hypothetical protein